MPPGNVSCPFLTLLLTIFPSIESWAAARVAPVYHSAGPTVLDGSVTGVTMHPTTHCHAMNVLDSDEYQYHNTN